MGYYIETGTTRNKANLILERLGGIVITQSEAENALTACRDCAVVCVVDNGLFEAAAYCHSPKEFQQFSRVDDDRPKTWLLIENKAEVEKATGYSR